MRRLGTLLSSAAALALVCGVVADAKPNKQVHARPTLRAERRRQRRGEVGINVTAYGDLAMTVVDGTSLAEVLDFAEVQDPGHYSGIGRVLKGKSSRLDFGFNYDGRSCREPGSDDGPPPISDPGICRYHLVVAYGIYDRKADLVVFEGSPDARALLYDRHESLNEDGFLDEIAAGYAILNVQFE